MNQRKMGRTGLRVSELCLGTMTFAGQSDEPTSRRILDRATDGGITFIDTADAYPIPPDPTTAGRTEEVIGRWLRGRRNDFVVATKCRIRVGDGPNDEGLSRRHVLAACEASLLRLQTDWIDLYQLHLPDPETPLEETLRALDDLVRSGKVRYIGVSNYPAWQIALGLGISERLSLARFDCVQPRYNLLYRDAERELLPFCRDQGLGVIAYNPLAGGFLTGKYLEQFQESSKPPDNTRFTLGISGELYRDRYWKDAQFNAVKRLKTLVDDKGLSMVRVAVAWVLAQKGLTSAIIGASHPDQLDESLAARDLELDQELTESCDAAWWSLPQRPLSR